MKLRISNLSKSFGSHQVLNQLACDFANIHSLVLIGPSGGGKTTLLRILAGLVTPDSGEVELNGEVLAFDESALLRHRRQVGVVFQAFNLFPHLTALENITLPLEKAHGYAADNSREIAMQLLKRFQLAAHAAKKPAALSGGQRQRVAIARALAVKPRVLFFDEPTSALDPEMTAEVLDMIRELRTEGQDLVLVTHEMGFARVVADRIAFLSDGRIVEYGTSDQVFNSAQTEACRKFLSLVLKY
ncbi:MAG TPA: amino acid ABC transporter ATP-binding protein [Candidatus Limnocylindrales bacterium]|nr:amino acid ABC transporter ATP-binding protein [Candidatus Limnocylindrales bacterium]